MKFSRLLVFACVFGGGSVIDHAAEATQPVDYTQRNGMFAPVATVVADATKPGPATAIQDKRVETITVDKKTAAVGDRRAAIDVAEARDKIVREKDSHRPEAPEQRMSAFNHREALVATGADTTKPGLVEKYQSSLVAASASNMARFPAATAATTAKINRFVFRKNAPDAGAALDGAAVVPAAGGSPALK